MTGAGDPRATRAIRVAVLVEDEETQRAIERLVAAWLPDAAAGAALVEGTAPEVRGLPAADVLILEAGGGGERAVEPVRRARAAGFRGGIVIAVPGDPAGGDGPPAEAELARLGGIPWPLGSGAGERLGAVLEAALDAALAGEEVPGGRDTESVRAELWEVRRRLAVAGVASGMQHTLNNSLAALLAEAQLLELEPLLPEQRSAVRRMVELCRRMSREVCALAAPLSPPPAPGRGGAERDRRTGGGWFGHHIG